MNCVSYMRCSGESQISGDTWERQTEKIQALAARQGFTIEHEWREEGISGKIECEQRPAFQAMLAHLLSNGCRTIIVEDLSRLARRYAVQEQILLYLCAKGITLWTCANGGQNITEEMNQDPTKRLLIGIVGLVSQWEREQLVEKLRVARQRIKTKLGKCEGRKSYGHNPEEKPILARMLFLQHQEGYSVDRIAKTLNDEGVLTRYGKRWTWMTISRILARNRSESVAA
jgi:DNA invertase Pin-like site-specific DNA recombinase